MHVPPFVGRTPVRGTRGKGTKTREPSTALLQGQKVVRRHVFLVDLRAVRIEGVKSMSRPDPIVALSGDVDPRVPGSCGRTAGAPWGVVA